GLSSCPGSGTLVPAMRSEGTTFCGPTWSLPAMATRYPNAVSCGIMEVMPSFTAEWLLCAPCFIGYMALNSELLEGPQVGEAANACSKTIDSRLSLSK